jgi:hypothetical protein
VYYVDADTAREALQRRSQFNVIDMGTAWKADLIIRKARAFSVEEFARRQSGVDGYSNVYRNRRGFDHCKARMGKNRATRHVSCAT